MLSEINEEMLIDLLIIVNSAKEKTCIVLKEALKD